MAFKWAPNGFFDSDALDGIEADCDEITICTDDLSATPTYTECHTTYMLVYHTMTGADFTVGDGETSGRKVEVAEQANLTIDSSGDAAQVCLLDTGSTAVLYVTTCDIEALAAANQVTIPAWDIEVRDPA